MADLRLGDYREQLAGVESFDAAIFDPPYSDTTHTGHRHGVTLTGSGYEAKKSGGYYARPSARRAIDYDPWSAADIVECVELLAPRCRGWFVLFTDHLSVPVWTEALRAQGRYVFAPLSYVVPGSRVRQAGDGPALWSVQIVVARPRVLPFSKWGALPGAYVLPPGLRDLGRGRSGPPKPIVGGKEDWICEQLVRDYSAPGDLILDPTCGGGSQLVAAETLGRRAIGCELDPEHYAIALDRLAQPRRQVFAHELTRKPIEVEPREQTAAQLEAVSDYRSFCAAWGAIGQHYATRGRAA